MNTRSHTTRWLLAALTCLVITTPAAAQDSHYWDNQYGTKAELLGGLVVGAPSDISATYYNPGWIALGTDPSLLMTTYAAEYSKLSIEEALGKGFSPDHTQLRSAPGFLGGRINAKKTTGWQLSWAYIEKVRFEFDAAGLRIDSEPTTTPEGDFWFVGETFRRTKTSEYWYGFSMARQIGKHTALGISPFVAYRNTTQRLQTTAQLTDATDRYLGAYYVDQLKYNHTRLLAKIGLAFDYDPVTFGLTVTTPGLRLSGSGEVYQNTTLSGRTENPDLSENFLAADAQMDLEASWKTPLSMAVGASFQTGTTRIHTTVEWFNAVSSYDVLSPTPFQSQTTGETIEYDLETKARSLINWGLGLDHRFPGKVSIYGGFRSDYSTQEGPQTSEVLMTTWDLWHASTGASFKFLGIELTTGLEYSYGSGTNYRYISFDEEGEVDVIGKPTPVEVKYRRLKGLVGFDLSFLMSGG